VRVKKYLWIIHFMVFSGLNVLFLKKKKLDLSLIMTLIINFTGEFNAKI